MRQIILNLCTLCVIAALLDQVIHNRALMRPVRMVLGLEICRALMILMKESVSMLN